MGSVWSTFFDFPFSPRSSSSPAPAASLPTIRTIRAAQPVPEASVEPEEAAVPKVAVEAAEAAAPAA